MRMTEILATIAYYITAPATMKPNFVEKRDTVLVPDVTISFNISTRLPG